MWLRSNHFLLSLFAEDFPALLLFGFGPSFSL